MKQEKPTQDKRKAVKSNRKRYRYYLTTKKQRKEIQKFPFGWNHALFSSDIMVLLASMGYFNYVCSCLKIQLWTCRTLFLFASYPEVYIDFKMYCEALMLNGCIADRTSFNRNVNKLVKSGYIVKHESEFRFVVSSYTLYILEQLKKDFEGLSALRSAP